MRKLVFAALALLSILAHAEKALVTPGLNAKAGDTISLENRAIFYIDRKCELPIVNAKSMRHYVFYRGKNGPNEVGCWGATIDDMVFTVAPRAEPFTAPLEVLLFADVDQNGTAKIIGKYSKSQK